MQTLQQPPTDPVGAYLDWFRDVRRRERSSVEQYTTTLRAFERHCGNVLTATPRDVERFVGRKRRRSPNADLLPPAPATVAKERTIVSAMYNHFQDRLWRADNPVRLTGAPKVHNRQPKAIRDSDWMQLWASPMEDADRAFLGLGVFAGLRRLEIVRLSPQMVDVSRRELNNLPRKGGNTLPVEYGSLAETVGRGLPHLLPEPRVWFDALERLVLDRPHVQHLMPFVSHARSERQVSYRLSRLLLDAGLPEYAFSPHAMRHSCATNLLRCGVPLEIVADQLGHASIETTRRYLSTSGQLGRWLSER